MQKNKIRKEGMNLRSHGRIEEALKEVRKEGKKLDGTNEQRKCKKNRKN